MDLILENTNKLLPLLKDSNIVNNVNNYYNNMLYLLKIYDNGKGKILFVNNYMELYFKLYDEFSDIIDLRYKITNDNKNKYLVYYFDTIISLHRDILEDLNTIVV